MKESRVHLVGSIPLHDAGEAMRAVGERLGGFVSRVSDGETGARSDWIQSLAPVFEADDRFERITIPADSGRARHYCAPRAGIDAATLDLPEFGYARAAKASYGVFRALRAENVLPAQARFMVALPTPAAVQTIYIAPDSRRAMAPAILRRFRAEIDAMLEEIPAGDLAIQWDVVFEILSLEGVRTIIATETRADIVEGLREIVSLIPASVEAGFHFCYGDFKHRHSLEPKDMGTMVDLWNEIVRTAPPKLSFLHMPVPRERDDDAYFAPLYRLDPAGAEIYLGLIHFTDGMEGARRRMEAARRRLSSFGLATECGFGRRPPDSVYPLLDLHRALALENLNGREVAP